MNIDEFKKLIAACKTDKQVIKAIESAGYSIIKNDTKEIGSFSVWLTDTIRIYKRRNKEYILQQWKKIEYQYSGIPTFFATNSYF